MSLDANSVQRAIAFAVVIFIVQGVARFVWNCRRRSLALKHLPGPTYGWLGIIDALRRRQIHRSATEWANVFGPIFRVRLLWFHAVVITDPELAREVLHSPHLDKLRYLYSFLDPFLGGTNLLTGHTDAHWKAVRKGVAPAFSAGNMRHAFKHIVERSGVLTGILAKSGPARVMNMDNLLLRESMDVIGRVGFEKEMGALEDFMEGDVGSGASVDVMLRCTHEVERRARQGPQRMLKIWRKDVRHGYRLMEQWQCVVRSLLKHMQLGTPGKGTFAHMLLRVKDPATGQPLTDAKMLPEIAALYFAGIDTTGHSGAWTLYLLSQYPEVEARVVAELDALELLVTPARPQPRELEWADLGRLTYLQAVIKEVLRMYPPVGLGQIRVNSKRDLILAGGRMSIPAGTALWVPHHAMHNVHHNWDRADDFLPERWLEAGTEYATRRTMPAEWYRGWAPEAAEVAPTSDADVAQFSIQADATGTTGSTASVGALSMPAGTTGAVPQDKRGANPNPSPAVPGLGNEIEEAELGGRRRAKRYFPFAEGQRHCVGMSLANITLPATLAVLLSRFSFKLADEMGGPEGVLKTEQYTLITGMAKGMLMNAVPRPGVAAE
ncbi:hypothetical protein WJX81_006830 [Elliptochloris bilobata]|uniref:Cytochrome P450 n=1 Tax=Elliptochloris bilobata TaxID=381761 RepID=A0AAW1R278_9CHLO